jgi:rhodanese-related sulfurtransferase
VQLKVSSKILVDQATAEITTLSVSAAQEAQEDGSAILVDIRDIRELDREGRVPKAVHAPRGMLEFWVDPESPYHRDVFAQSEKTYIFFCAAAWRSALATKALQDMGMENVAHIEGGFSAWKEQDAPIEFREKTNK